MGGPVFQGSPHAFLNHERLVPGESQERGYSTVLGVRGTGSPAGVGVRYAGKAENATKARGWKSLGWREHTQAGRSNVPPHPAPPQPTQTSQPTESSPKQTPLEPSRVLVMVPFQQPYRKENNLFPNYSFVNS